MFSINIVLYILDNYLNLKAINLKFWNTLVYQKIAKYYFQSMYETKMN